MSYRRTVRCSYCYETGHNKAGCPAYKKKIEEWRAAGIFMSTVEAYDRKKARKTTAAKTRKCSWCGDPGHTRRTCSTFKVHFEKLRAAQSAYVMAYAKALAEAGLTPGAMFTWDSESSGDNAPQIVTSVDWDSMLVTARNNYTIRYLQPQSIGSGFLGRQYNPRPQLIDDDHWRRLNVNISVPGNSAAFMQSIPADIADGTRVTKLIFKENARDWWFSAENFDDWLNRSHLQFENVAR